MLVAAERLAWRLQKQDELSEEELALLGEEHCTWPTHEGSPAGTLHIALKKGHRRFC